MSVALLVLLPRAIVGQGVPAAARDPVPELLSRIIRDTTLANGLTVITVENHTVPLATIEVVVRTGGFTQDSSTTGVPHLFEHMLFKGFSGPSGESFAQDASDLNAQYNGTTASEQVSYYMTVPATALDPSMELLAQLVRDPVFAQADLDEERQVVNDEFARDHSSPQFRLEQAVERRLWSTGWVIQGRFALPPRVDCARSTTDTTSPTTPRSS
jgi:predicted Zn-dependent peptidase